MKAKTSFTAPILVMVIIALLFASRFIDASILEYGQNVYLSIIIIQLLIFVLPGIFYAKIKGQSFTSDMKLKFFGLSKFPFVISSCFVLVLGCSIINLILFYTGVTVSEFSLYNTYIPDSPQNLMEILYLTIAFAIVPAIAEEFVFRGVLLTDYEKNGPFFSVFITSVLFAMVHFSIRQFLIYFFAGVILGLTAYITKSLFASVAVHIFNNIFGLFFESYMWKLIKQPDNIVFFIFILTALFLIFLIIMFSSAENIFYSYGLENAPSPKAKEKTSVIYSLLSPTFLVCFLMFICITVGIGIGS